MREVPLAENPEAVDFAHRVISGQIDIVILMTGVGLRHLVAQVERHVTARPFLWPRCRTSRPWPAGRSRWPR